MISSYSETLAPPRMPEADLAILAVSVRLTQTREILLWA